MQTLCPNYIPINIMCTMMVMVQSTRQQCSPQVNSSNNMISQTLLTNPWRKRKATIFEDNS